MTAARRRASRVRLRDPTDRRILQLAVPALGALAVEPLYLLVDTAIVGRLGTEHLAGLAIAATVLSFVVAGSNFLTYGTTEQIARRVGSDDRRGVADVGTQAIWAALLVGMVVAPVLVFGASSVSRAFGASGEVLGLSTEYLQIRAIGVPFVLFTLAVQGVFRGVADYRTPLVVLLAANAANVVIELVLVFGLGLGMAGAAWSTVVSQLGAAVGFGWLVRRLLAGASGRRLRWTLLAPLMTAGRHLVVRVGAMLAVFGGATAIAARVDEPTRAAHQIAMSTFILVSLMLDALAMPAQTLVAGELGRGDRRAALHVAARVVHLSIRGALRLTVALLVAAPLLPWAFTGDGAVAGRATVALVVLALVMVPAAIAFAHDGILIGAGDYRFLGLAALGYLAAVSPIGIVLVRVEGAGILGIWLGLAVWMLLRAAVNDRRTHHVLAC